MNPNILPSNRATVVGVIDPSEQGPGAVSTAWVDMQMFGSLLAVLQFGDFEAGAAADIVVSQARDDQGDGTKPVPGKTVEDFDDDDSQVLINVYDHELDINDGFRFVRVTLTVADDDSFTAGVVLAMDARYQPAEHAASVEEVVGV